MKHKIYVLFILLALTSCNTQADVPTPTNTPIPTETPAPPTQTFTPTETPTPTLPAEIDLASWIGLSANQKTEAYATAPDVSPEGYTKGDLSTVHDYLTKYYQDGKLVGAYNHLTNEFQSPAEAGIIEFDAGGTPLEMLFFASVDQAIDYAAQESLWLNEAEISRFDASNEFVAFTGPQQMLDLVKHLRQINGHNPRNTFGLPFDNSVDARESYFILHGSELEQPENNINGTNGLIKDKAGMYVPFFVGIDYASFAATLENMTIAIPPVQE